MSGLLQRSFDNVNSADSLPLENRLSTTTIFDKASKYGINELPVTLFSRIEKRGLPAPSFPIQFKVIIESSTKD
jgi:hypothetical protein